MTDDAVLQRRSPLRSHPPAFEELFQCSVPLKSRIENMPFNVKQYIECETIVS
jgi:hypothetical protein